MRANDRLSTLLLLLAVACNRPDSDLFSNGPAAPSGGGDQSVGGSSNGAAAGTTATAGGETSAPSVGGAGLPGVDGNPIDGGGAGGGASTPDPNGNGTAGAPDAAAGSGSQQPGDPVCGNGVLESGEQCDDAGHAGEDGCNADCEVVCADYGDDTAESADHHCYAGYDEASFDAAQAACVARGGHLATITSAAENTAVRSLVNTSKWVGGLEDVALTSIGSGDYGWITGEAFGYVNWADDEPDSGRTRCAQSPTTFCYEHCISLLGNGTWADQRCDVVDGYVCEWEPAGTQ